MNGSETKKYSVTGMSCASCQAHVERAVSGVEGVDSCCVSLLTNSMTVTGHAAAPDVIKAVEDAGYGARLDNETDNGSGRVFESMAEQLVNSERPVLVKRLVSSTAILLVLLYFSMGVTMWGWPAPADAGANTAGAGIIEMVLAGIILVINRKFFINGFKALLHKSTNMDTLVALGSGISFVYSVAVLVRMIISDVNGSEAPFDGHLYFESAAMILTLITVGKLLEAISKGRTTNALKELLDLRPETAVLIKDEVEVTVPVGDVRTGDIFVVRPGSSVPVDGIIIEGDCALDESALTGESVPVDKVPGDHVFSATINRTGFIRCRAEKVGEDTSLAQIIRMVSDSSASKAPIARIADKVSGIFVPAVLIIAAVVLVVWLLTGASFGDALTRAISVLVVSCPCALGLATPVAVMVGNGVAAKNGILFKTAASLEQTGKAEIIVLDKTGTITSGVPVVTDVIPACGISRDELLSDCYALEKGSEHPLGKALTGYCESAGTELKTVTDFKVLSGNGLEGVTCGRKVYGGNLRYISTVCKISPEMLSKSEELAGQGKIPLFFASEGNLTGIVALADKIKDDSAEAVDDFKRMGLVTVMLTGDNSRTAAGIAGASGVDIVISDVLPGDKQKVIDRLKAYGKVIMVGDGINDAPALVSADVGIAVGAGTDIAIGSADCVLMKSGLADSAAAVRISRRTVRNIRENLFWAFIYNAVLIPVAAGAFASLGLTVSPMLCAAAMSISSFTVCMNALRLNLIKPYGKNRDKSLSNIRDSLAVIKKESENMFINSKENTRMEKTITIEGMMCGHCEATVRKALEAIEGVVSADVSHDKGTAVVVLESDVANEILSKAVEDKDFKVTGIE